jgi:hypothetical protein
VLEGTIIAGSGASSGIGRATVLYPGEARCKSGRHPVANTSSQVFGDKLGRYLTTHQDSYPVLLPATSRASHNVELKRFGLLQSLVAFFFDCAELTEHYLLHCVLQWAVFIYLPADWVEELSRWPPRVPWTRTTSNLQHVFQTRMSIGWCVNLLPEQGGLLRYRNHLADLHDKCAGFVDSPIIVSFTSKPPPWRDCGSHKGPVSR